MDLLAGERATSSTGNANVAIADVVRRAIVRGEIRPGERLKESDVALRLGVSRTPVREAFLVLHTEGLLELQPGRGARVRSYGPHDLGMVSEMRALLEGCAARYAAERVSDRHLALLEASCERMAELPVGDEANLNEENVRFHNTIITIVGNAKVTHIARALLEIPFPCKQDYWNHPDGKRHSEIAHRRIYEALRKRDGLAAETAVREHLTETGRRMVAALRTAGPANDSHGSPPPSTHHGSREAR